MKVTIFQYRLFHYRKRFFEVLRERCLAEGVSLNVVYGQAYGSEVLKKDSAELDWGLKVRSYYFPIKEKKDLCWQPAPISVRDSDVFVFMHENRLLANYWWLVRRFLGIGPKVAFWGHGKDFQSRAPNGFREKWKEITIRWPDWWFAYTDLTKRIVLQSGFPVGKISVVNNAIDNEMFARDLDSIDDSAIAAFIEKKNILKCDIVALYCGSLYDDKRIDFLIEACDQIHRLHPNFRLLIAGDGAHRVLVEEAARSRPWIDYVGSVQGTRKALCFRVARFSLCPGAVGLNILDSFIAGTPLVTMENSKHGPEIGFLKNGVNGICVDGDIPQYVMAVDQLIRDDESVTRLRNGGLAAAKEYTVDKMVENFLGGLLAMKKHFHKEVTL